MAVRNHNNTSPTDRILSGGVIALDTVLPVNDTTGFPTAPYFATLALGGASPEVVLVQSSTPTSVTVLRAQGGTSAVPHSAGTSIKHTAVAADFAEANAHVNATSAAHGVTGALVGTTDTQTLTNKTLTAPVLNQATGNASASAPAALLKAAASGAQDIVQFANSAGTALARFTQVGGMQAINVTVLPTADANHLEVHGVAAQTGRMIVAKNSLGNHMFEVNRYGKTAITPVVEDSGALLSTKNASASPTGNAFEHRLSTNTLVARVSATGEGQFTGLQANTNGIFDKIKTSDDGFRVTPDNDVFAANMGGLIDHIQDSSGSQATTAGAEVIWTDLNKAFTLVSGRKYKITLTVLVDSVTANTPVRVRIRNSKSGSAPTTASTEIARWQEEPATFAVVRTWTKIYTADTTGTNTFGVSVERASGVGEVSIGTESAGAACAELIVEDVGI